MTDNNVMTLAALRKMALASKPLTDAQYASATATAQGSHVVTRATLALVAYAVSERGTAGTAVGGESLTRLAGDTLPTADHSPKAWRSTLSKYAGAVRYAVTAGVLDTIDAAGIDRLVRGYDSTADGRKILTEAATAATGKDDALALLLTAADAAIATKAAARKGNGNVPDKGDESETSKRTAAPNDGTATVPLNWAQTLAMLASTAAAETAALDIDALAMCSALVASIGDALADASATASAALATAKSKRK